MSSFITV